MGSGADQFAEGDAGRGQRLPAAAADGGPWQASLRAASCSVLQPAADVLGNQVGFEIDGAANGQPTQARHGERVRDQGDAERLGITSTTVRLTPSIVIDPLPTIWARSSGGAVNRQVAQSCSTIRSAS